MWAGRSNKYPLLTTLEKCRKIEIQIGWFGSPVVLESPSGLHANSVGRERAGVVASQSPSHEDETHPELDERGWTTDEGGIRPHIWGRSLPLGGTGKPSMTISAFPSSPGSSDRSFCLFICNEVVAWQLQQPCREQIKVAFCDVELGPSCHFINHIIY